MGTRLLILSLTLLASTSAFAQGPINARIASEFRKRFGGEINVSGQTNGQVLSWNATTNRWEAAAGGSFSGGTLDSQVAWATGAGSIWHLQGPTDQPFGIQSGSGQDLILGTNGTARLTIADTSGDATFSGPVYGNGGSAAAVAFAPNSSRPDDGIFSDADGHIAWSQNGTERMTLEGNYLTLLNRSIRMGNSNVEVGASSADEGVIWVSNGSASTSPGTINLREADDTAGVFLASHNTVAGILSVGTSKGAGDGYVRASTLEGPTSGSLVLEPGSGQTLVLNDEGGDAALQVSTAGVVDMISISGRSSLPGGTQGFLAGGGGISLGSAAVLQWKDNATAGSGSADTILSRDAESVLALKGDGDATTAIRLYDNDASAYAEVGHDGTNMRLDSSAGFIRIMDSMQGEAGSAGIPTYSWNGDPDSGLYSGGADQLNWTTGGTSRLTLSTSVLQSSVLVQCLSNLSIRDVASDPSDPANGWFTIFQSDGTGSGDDGDIMLKITDSGGTTKTITLVDFSAS